jgi:hypothetical protein
MTDYRAIFAPVTALVLLASCAGAVRALWRLPKPQVGALVDGTRWLAGHLNSAPYRDAHRAQAF